jgi:hypothetical protein
LTFARFAYPSPPKKWTAEHEMEVPELLRDASKVPGDGEYRSELRSRRDQRLKGGRQLRI